MENSLKNTLVYTISELADVLKISKSTAYQLARAKDFPKMYIGKRILIPLEDLKIWIKENCNG